MDDVPFQRCLGTKIGKAIGDFFESKGVKIVGNSVVSELTGDKNLRGVKTKNIRTGQEAEVSANVAIIGAG